MTDDALMTPDAIEGFLKQLAPELDAGPLYVHFASALPSEFVTVETCAGATNPTLDVELREFAPWRGRGPAMLIHNPLLRRYAEEFAGATKLIDPEPFIERALRRSILSVAIHEAAHILERSPPYYVGDESTQRWHNDGPLHLARLLASIPPFAEDLPRQRSHHELTFIRVALHLEHRAARLRARTNPYDLFTHDNYRLSPLPAYAERLGAEPEFMADWPFTAIVSAPMPQKFKELWESDINREEKNPC